MKYTAQAPRILSSGPARLAAFAIVCACVIGGMALAGAVGRAERERVPPSAAARTLEGDGVRLDLPAGWSPVVQGRGLPRWALEMRLAARQDSLPLHVAAGMLPARSRTLLPPRLVRELRSSLPRPTRVVLPAGLSGYEYTDLMPKNGNRVVDVLVVPTTAGVATVVCVAAREAASVIFSCDSIARSLSVSAGRAVPLGPAAAFHARLAHELRRLARVRSSERTAVEGGEPAAAARLARSHRAAGGVLNALAPRSDAVATVLARSILAQGRVYAQLGLALRRGDRGEAVEASRRILAHDEQIRLLLRRVGSGRGEGG